MSFLHIALLVSFLVYNLSQLLELNDEEEESDSSNHNLPNQRLNLSQYLSNSTSENEVTSESVPLSDLLEPSCAVSIFAIEKTVKMKDKEHLTLREGSLMNGALIFGYYLLTAADLVQSVQETLVLKMPKNVVKVSRIFIIDGTNIAVLKLCRKVVNVPSCGFAYEQVYPKSICSSIPLAIESDSFSYGGNSFSRLNGTSVQCPNKRSSFCCFKANKNVNNKGAGIFSGLNVLGIMTGEHSCQAESVNCFTPIKGRTHFKIHHAVSLSLDRENCKNLTGRIPERI